MTREVMTSIRNSVATWSLAAGLVMQVFAATPVNAQQRPVGTPPEALEGGELVWISDAGPETGSAADIVVQTTRHPDQTS